MTEVIIDISDIYGGNAYFTSTIHGVDKDLPKANSVGYCLKYSKVMLLKAIMILY